jgi:phage N-6-adenine-methyltransferase
MQVQEGGVMGDRTMPAQKPGRSKQDYETPRVFLDAVERRYGPMAFDLAARADNAKAPNFITPERNSLLASWGELGSGNRWLNPPFGAIANWAAKCAREHSSDRRIFFLVPASIGANWFAESVHEKALVIALQGRLSFDGKNPFPKDCMLCVYGEPPGFEVWRWGATRVHPATCDCIDCQIAGEPTH